MNVKSTMRIMNNAKLKKNVLSLTKYLTMAHLSTFVERQLVRTITTVMAVQRRTTLAIENASGRRTSSLAISKILVSLAGTMTTLNVPKLTKSANSSALRATK